MSYSYGLLGAHDYNILTQNVQSEDASKLVSPFCKLFSWIFKVNAEKISKQRPT